MRGNIDIAVVRRVEAYLVYQFTFGPLFAAEQGPGAADVRLSAAAGHGVPHDLGD